MTRNNNRIIRRTAGVFVAVLIFAPALVLAVTFVGNVQFTQNLAVGGSISKGSGSFAIDHPQDPHGKLLIHSFVESPDVKNVYDGVVVLDANGEAHIELPDYFEALNKDFRYQLFPHGAPAPGLYVREEVSGNTFIIAGGNPNQEVSWQVTGVRHDPFIVAYPIIPEVEKGPEELVDRGEYVNPEAYE